LESFLEFFVFVVHFFELTSTIPSIFLSSKLTGLSI
jgi:hypothetical protein